MILGLIIFLFFFYPPADYDLGWHLRYGQYFWEHGRVLWENTFSYTLPFFRWANHSWLYDILIYPIFNLAGWWGLAILGPLLVFLALIIVFRTVKAAPLEQLLAAGIFSFLGSHSLTEGVRSRYSTFVFLAVLYWIIDRGRRKFYFFWLLLPLFVLWANLHGTFTEGLLFLGLTWLTGIYDVVREPRKYFYPWLALGGVTAAAGAATMLNPFGLAVAQEAILHASSPYLRLVQEYAPLAWQSEAGVGMGIYLAVLVGALWWRKNKEFFLEAVALLPFLYLAVDGLRNISVFILLSLPLAIKLLRPLTEKLQAAKIYPTVFPLVLLAILTGLLFRIPPMNLSNYTWNDYCRFSSGCSEKAAAFLREHPPRGRGLTFYDWGGYLNWRVPNVKTFIDGRMHLWQVGDHYIMDIYMQLLAATGDWEKAFHDFDFAWAILPPTAGIRLKIDLLVQNRLWEKVYNDQTTVIYVRKIPPPRD